MYCTWGRVKNKPGDLWWKNLDISSATFWTDGEERDISFMEYNNTLTD